MLEELHIASLGVIPDASLRFAPGLNVLTGETGAGKTMVTVGLALATGSRAAAGLIREGSEVLSVEAMFAVPPAQPPLDEWAEDGRVLLARVVRTDGKSTARVSGRLAPASTLGEIGERLVEIHGQRQAERLLSPAAQTVFLDAYAGQEHLDQLVRYRELHATLRRARERLRILEGEAREREREKDLLGYQIREIEAARVEAGEAPLLGQEESRLANVEQILAVVAAMEGSLGEDGGGVDRAREAAAAARSVGQLDRGFDPLAERLASLAAEGEDALAELRAYRDRLESDPERLQEVRDRIQLLRSLEPKYGDGEEGILAYLEEARSRLSDLEGASDERDRLAAEVDELTGAAGETAERVTKGRTAAAHPLHAAITEELQELGMPGASVEIGLVAGGELGPDGAERAEFGFSGGPVQPLQPLGKVASGGELSRTMLACRSVLAELDDVPTLVFDEVDAGIGGRTAAAVGRRLARLAERRQVLVVTHLAQIAAHADRHFVVTKEGGSASVRPVEGDERVAELARMLSGSTGRVSLAHARELIGDAVG